MGVVGALVEEMFVDVVAAPVLSGEGLVLQVVESCALLLGVAQISVKRVAAMTPATRAALEHHPVADAWTYGRAHRMALGAEKWTSWRDASLARAIGGVVRPSRRRPNTHGQLP